MPQFNPDLPGQDQEKGYTGRSEGVRSEREINGPPVKSMNQSGYYKAKAEVAGTDQYGNILKGVVEGTDYLVQSHIQNTIMNQKSQIDDEFGVGAAATGQADIALQPQPTPAALEQAGRDVEGVTAAYQSGRLKESHYWARLESMVRQMKTRFPGYRDEIDSMVSKVAGTTPANALRNQLQAEAEAQLRNAANDPVTKQVQGMASNATLARAFPQGVFNDDGSVKYTLPQLIEGEARITAGDKEVEAATAKLNWRAKNNENVEEDSFLLAKKGVDTILGDYIRSETNEETLKTLTKLSNSAVKGGIGGGEQAAQLSLQLKEAETNLLRQADEMLLKEFPGSTPGGPTSSFSMILTQQHQMDVKAGITTYFKNFQDDLTEGNYNLIKMDAVRSQAMTDKAGADILQRHPILVTNAALREKLGPEVLNALMGQAPDNMNATTKAINDLAVSQIANGEASLSQSLDNLRQAGVKDPKAYMTVLNSTSKILTTEGTDEVKVDAVKGLFGPENRELLAKLPPEYRLQAYRTFTSPDMQKSMLKMKETDPASFNTYKAWVTHSAEALFMKEAQDTQSAVVDRDMVTIRWDEKAHQLSVIPLPGIRTSSAAGELYERSVMPGIRASVARLNAEISGIAPLYAADGQDPGAEIGQILKGMGIDPTANKSGPLMTQVSAAIGTVLEAAQAKIEAAADNFKAGAEGVAKE